MHSNMLSSVVQTHSLPFWYYDLHPLMPSSHHLLSSCTNASLGPPFLPESTTLPQQPSRFMSELMPTPMPPSHRLTNDANPLLPCTGQSIVMYDTLHKIWIPAIMVCVLPKDSYQVHTSNGMVYCHMR